MDSEKKEVGKTQDNRYFLGNNFNCSKSFTESYGKEAMLVQHLTDMKITLNKNLA